MPGQRGRKTARRVLGVFSAVAVACGAVACADDQQASDSVEAAALDAAPALEVDAAKVTVLNAGEGEKSVLAYRPATEEQTVQEGTVRIAQGFSQQIAAGDVSPLPPEDSDVIGLRAPYTARTVGADGARMVSVTLGQGRFDDLERAQQVQAAADGFGIRLAALDSGQVRTVKLAAPDAAEDTGRAMVESLVMTLLATPLVFPDEPIGEGAVWELDSRVPGSNAVLQRTTWTLVKREGDAVDLQVSVSQRPTQAALDLGSVGGRGQLKVLSSETLSRGFMHLDLSLPLPTTGSIQAITRVVYGQPDDDNTEDSRVVQDSSFLVEYAPQGTKG